MENKLKTVDGFTKWYDQKYWGSKKGSFGKPKETTGKILTYSDFLKLKKDGKLYQK